jgi:3-hydroxyacyl-CoA dehydrogenase
MRLGMNHPMGPLTLADFIGLDTCLAIMEVLHRELGDSKYRPAVLLRQYVDTGFLGTPPPTHTQTERDRQKDTRSKANERAMHVARHVPIGPSIGRASADTGCGAGKKSGRGFYTYTS